MLQVFINTLCFLVVVFSTTFDTLYVLMHDRITETISGLPVEYLLGFDTFFFFVGLLRGVSDA